jgi:fructose-1,6-bisphosphatase/sedoheptulose 1,7-bisphosphatase-like protein
MCTGTGHAPEAVVNLEVLRALRVSMRVRKQDSRSVATVDMKRERQQQRLDKQALYDSGTPAATLYGVWTQKQMSFCAQDSGAARDAR